MDCQNPRLVFYVLILRLWKNIRNRNLKNYQFPKAHYILNKISAEYLSFFKSFFWCEKLFYGFLKLAKSIFNLIWHLQKTKKLQSELLSVSQNLYYVLNKSKRNVFPFLKVFFTLHNSNN